VSLNASRLILISYAKDR